ncbi:hypothetical protein TSOC_014536 [Tetrabaena socialis]|uniref:Uncharacterized protein n=1 Tax=Tetrabaena socialis TaxID=47790 RepID=A0A2J7ZHC5_9CHLO|nr:hypothetical protein TSOC_014536 [Tetrabaena socialis]|eukprot:PNG99678.1 hypothetical protein TSOC_014536 [Tetrabaena socialis]
MRPQQLQGQGRGAASPEAGGPAPMHVDAAAGGAEADAAAAAAAAPCSGADRRLHMQQKVWWWLGPGQVQAGHISAVDRRSEPLLYSVRLEAQPSWEAAGGGGGGGGGEEVMATAACLLPYLVYGDRIMCRLPPQPSAPCAGSQLVAPSAEEGPCAWSCGLLEHCVFDGDEPAVQVLLLQGGERVPCLLPYDRIVPVQDVAEGSGGGWGRSRGREASEAAAAVAAAAPALAPGWLVPSTASAKLI